MNDLGLIDIGANLTHPTLYNQLDVIVENIISSETKSVIITSSCLKDTSLALNIINKHPDIFYTTTGFHPHNAKDFSSVALEEINDLLSKDNGIDRIVAIRAAKKKSKLASVLLDQIDNYHVNDEVFHYRLRTALLNEDWALLKKWTMGKPSIKDIELRWFYWHARALEETGESKKAKQIYYQLKNHKLIN